MLEELKALKSEEDKIKEIQEEWKAQGDELKDKWSNMKNTMTAIVNDPAAALTAAVTFLIAQMISLAKMTRDFANAMGESYANAAKASAQAKKLGLQYKLMGADAQTFVDAQQESLKLGMSMEDVLDGTAESVGYMSVRYGISASEAAKLNKTMLGMSQFSQQIADDMMDTAVALAKANKVAPGVVVQEMAENAGEFARAGKEGFVNMTMTAVAAKKLGMSMSKIAEIADGLLDIESSIEAEMNAQVMTGKKINLNYARQLANANNLVDMTKELVKQFGSAEEFASMGRLEQEAWANALGMSGGEMASMLQNANKLDGLSAAGVEHYNKTGEILEENESWFTAQNVALAATIATGVVALIQLVQQGGSLLKNLFLEKAITKEKQKQNKTSSKGGKGMGKGMNVKSMLKAAAGMIIIAAAMLIFAFAAKQFSDDINWDQVLIGSAILVGLGIAAAILGKFSSQIMQGALALLVLGIALIPAAFAFSLLAGVDPMAMIAFAGALIILGIAAAIFGIPVVLMAILLGSIAILALGLAIIPFAYAMSLLKGVDVLGTMAGIVALAMIGPLLAMAGIGMTLLGLGIWPFILAMQYMEPLVPAVLEFAGAMELLAAPLASLAAVAGGLLLVGPGLALIGLSLLPLALGLWALSFAEDYIPLLGMLGEHFALLAPPLAALGKVGEKLLFIGPGLAAIGLALPALAFGILALDQVATQIPLLGTLGEYLAILAPPLVMLAAVAPMLLLIGPALALIGLGLIPFSLGIFALGLVSSYIPLLAEMAPSLLEIAPALVAMSMAGEGMLKMGMGFAAFAGGLLLLVPALYALMPLMPMLLMLGGVMGTMGALGAFGGDEEEGEKEKTKEGPGNAEIISKLDQMILLLSQPGVINMDGRKVGEVLHMAKNLPRT